MTPAGLEGSLAIAAPRPVSHLKIGKLSNCELRLVIPLASPRQTVCNVRASQDRAEERNMRRYHSMVAALGIMLAWSAHAQSQETIDVGFTNRTKVTVVYFLNGGSGLETRLRP